MLRTILVALIILVGLGFSLTSPLYALMFYLWDAYFRPEQWLWTDWISGLQLSFIIGMYLVVALVLSPNRLWFSRRHVIFLLFAVHCMISMVPSDYTAAAWPFMVEFLKVLLVSYAITVFVDDLWKFRLTLLVIAFSLGLEEAKQGWGNILFTPGSANNNPHPVLGDNNGVALGMLMLLPIFIALLQTAPRIWERHIHRVFAFGVAIRAIVTYSRGGFIGAAALAAYYLLFAKRRVQTAIGVAVVGLVIFSIMPDTFWDRMNTINADEEDRDASARGRLHTWHVGWVMGLDKPIFGVGFHSFEFAYDRYDDTTGEFGTDRASHSTWFGVLGDLGFVGLGLFVIMLLQTLYVTQRLRRTPKDRSTSSEIRAYTIALQGSMVALIVSGTFLHEQYSEMVWHLFALVITLERVGVRIAQTTPLPTPQATPIATTLPLPAVFAGERFSPRA